MKQDLFGDLNLPEHNFQKELALDCSHLDDQLQPQIQIVELPGFYLILKDLGFFRLFAFHTINTVHSTILKYVRAFVLVYMTRFEDSRIFVVIIGMIMTIFVNVLMKFD